MIKSKQGFTLIEILIVVAIIAVLAGIVLVGLGPTTRKGNDARRIADLRQIQTALQLYYSRFGTFSGISSDISNVDFSGVGVNNLPKDPASPNRSYELEVIDSGSYILKAQLDDSNDVPKDSYTSGSNCDPAQAQYCVIY